MRIRSGLSASGKSPPNRTVGVAGASLRLGQHYRAAGFWHRAALLLPESTPSAGDAARNLTPTLFMADLRDGETTEMQRAGAKPYVLRNTGGVYSCSCPAGRNQSIAMERRTWKHLRKFRGDAAEEARVGGTRRGEGLLGRQTVPLPPRQHLSRARLVY
jgi:hypothetical protein